MREAIGPMIYSGDVVGSPQAEWLAMRGIWASNRSRPGSGEDADRLDSKCRINVRNGALKLLTSYRVKAVNRIPPLD